MSNVLCLLARMEAFSNSQATLIEEWGAHASPHCQKKYGLKNDVQKCFDFAQEVKNARLKLQDNYEYK